MVRIRLLTFVYNSCSESESSLEIDFDERHHHDRNNSMTSDGPIIGGGGGMGVPSASRQRTLSSPVPMNIAMSPTASKAPPPTPLAVSSPINQDLMPRPISPLNRQKTVCCPRCNHSFLASIGSYTNIFANTFSGHINSSNPYMNPSLAVSASAGHSCMPHPQSSASSSASVQNIHRQISSDNMIISNDLDNASMKSCDSAPDQMNAD